MPFRPYLRANFFLTLAIGLLFAVAIPPLRGPDETEHFDAIIQENLSPGFSSTDKFPELVISREIRAMSGTRARLPNPPITLSAFDEMVSVSNPAFSYAKSGTLNQMSQHPPIYYIAASAFTLILTPLFPEEMTNWYGWLLLLRLMSVLALAVTAALTTASVLYIWNHIESKSNSYRSSGFILIVYLSTILATTIVPMKFYVGSVISNDIFVVLGGAYVTFEFVRYVLVHPERSFLRVLLSCALAASTKLTALPFVAVVTGITMVLGLYEAIQRRRIKRSSGMSEEVSSASSVQKPVYWSVSQAWGQMRNYGRRHWKPIFAACTTSAIASIWYIRNLVSGGSIGVSGSRRASSEPLLTGWETNSENALRFLGWWSRFLSTQFWGNDLKTIFELPFSQVIMSWGIVVLGITFARSTTRLKFLVMVCLLSFAFQIVLLFRLNSLSFNTRMTGIAGAVHGRYLFAVVPLMSALVAVGWGQLALKLREVVDGSARCSKIRRSGIVLYRVTLGMIPIWTTYLSMSFLRGIWSSNWALSGFGGLRKFGFVFLKSGVIAYVYVALFLIAAFFAVSQSFLLLRRQQTDLDR